jgi:imidazole glycerol-phosphate synthase subunit HisH
MRPHVTILDYGMCNMLNVVRAFKHIDADVLVTDSASQAAEADRLVVPGVGAFSDSVAAIRERGYDDVIRRYSESDRPFLGICVGMQMLFEGSDEFGNHEGLGILEGRVKAIPTTDADGALQKVPHIGWSNLHHVELDQTWADSILSEHPNHDAVYFVHSFAAVPAQVEDRLADVFYGGRRICAAVRRQNITAVQFHPERSGEGGLNILRKFLEL